MTFFKARKIDYYLCAMLAAVALAFAAPQLGTDAGPLQLGMVTNVGIALVFFLHGASLSPGALGSGARNWRLHLFIQTSTYIAFPMAGAALYLGLADLVPADVRLGVFYLCAVSSTVSSAVAMTALGRGNVPSAVFNAAVSGLLGMVATPALMALVVVSSDQAFPVGPAIMGIALKLLLPFAVGQMLRPWLHALLDAHKPVTGFIDKGVIVLIVFTSFCNFVAAGLWTYYGANMIAAVFMLALLLLIAASAGTLFTARAIGFSPKDQVTAVFCGSQRSLANGAPIAKILFGADPALGMIMLPLMIYHQLQIALGSLLARRIGAPVMGD